MNEYSDEIGEHMPGPSENEFSHLNPRLVAIHLPITTKNIL